MLTKLSRLWNILGEGEIVSIVQLAAEHFQKHGRSLRIAVDEAGWRFNNLSEAQVAQIRKSSAGGALSNPIEKAIFYRIVSLLKQNVELLFVFDGPKRPAKRGRKGGNRIDYDRVRLLKELLRNLGVPYHQAPGEAEAECATLQQAGIVDAVWSDDGDALMFGTDFLIRTFYENGKGAGPKSKAHVRVFKTEKTRQRLGFEGLNTNGMVLVALLVGGDYDQKGLSGCGLTLALKAVRAGLGDDLAMIKTPPYCAQLQTWRDNLSVVIGKPVPRNSPNPRAMRYYQHPTVSSALQQLISVWEVQEIDEPTLADFVLAKFNINTKFYIKHILPLLITRKLRRPMYSSNVFGVEMVRPRGKKIGDALELEVKITYDPVSVTALNLSAPRMETLPENFEPLARTDCELPLHILQYAIPSIVEVARKRMESKASKSPAKPSRKRKASSWKDEGKLADSFSTPVKRRQEEKSEHVRIISGSLELIPLSNMTVVSPGTTNFIKSKISSMKPRGRHWKDHGSKYPIVAIGSIDKPIIID